MKKSPLRIFAFYKSNVNPRVPQYQQAVFRKFGQKIEYITNEDFEHGDFLNYACRNIKDTDFLVFFDVDCIPVQRNWLDKLLIDLQEPNSLVGAAQTANHLQDGKNIYVSPFFFGISTAYLKALNYPDMRMTEDMDAGQNLTKKVIENGGNVKYWWPTDIEKEEWYLHDPIHTKFGPGTTYNHLVYHAFFSRFDQSYRFIKKAKLVLGPFGKLFYIKIPMAYRKVLHYFRFK
jgi:hypothetical protein